MASEKDAKLLEALADCDSAEELEIILAKHLGKTEGVLMPRRITITYLCQLCGGVRKQVEVVKATSDSLSHTLPVGKCSLCDDRLEEWSKPELVRVLMNLLRYGNLRPEQVRWLRIGGDLTEQMMEAGFVRIPPIQIGEGELTYDEE